MEKETGNLIETVRRRKRVKRMKNGILLFLTGWIVLSIICCTVLLLRVSGIATRLDKLQTEYDKYIGTASGNATGKRVLVTDPELEIVNNDNYTSYASDDDNKAVQGEVQKVYLTFDDGPSDNTDAILKVLKKYNVKATFFVVGKTDEYSKKMYQRIVDEGHTLGLHSYSHKYSEIYQNLNSYKNDLTKLSDLIYDVTGVRSRYVRFPGGSSNQVSDVNMGKLIQYLDKNGYTYFDWNVVSGDATSDAYTADDLVDNVMKEVSQYQTSVVLMHDASNKTSTVEALKILIPKLLDMDMQILPIDENTKVIQHIQIKPAGDK